MTCGEKRKQQPEYQEDNVPKVFFFSLPSLSDVIL